MDKKFNGTTVETNGVRSIAGGGTGAVTAEQARINLGITGGGVTSYNQLTDRPTLGTAAATAASDYATTSHTHFQPNPELPTDNVSSVSLTGAYGGNAVLPKIGDQQYGVTTNDSGDNHGIWKIGNLWRYAFTSVTTEDSSVQMQVESLSDGAYPWLATWPSGFTATKAALPRQIGQPLATTASEGTSSYSARADHVHPFPTALQVGAAPIQGGKIPSQYLPSYVDDVVEYASLAALQSDTSARESGKIYVTRDTGKIYRWSGSGYIEISQTLELEDLQIPDIRADISAFAGGMGGNLSVIGVLNGKNSYTWSGNNGYSYQVFWTGTQWKGVFEYNGDGTDYQETISTSNTTYPWQAAGWTNGGSVTRVGTYNAVLAPAPLAADAYSGIGTRASREDHVHPLPTPAQIGAEPAISTLPISKGGTGATTATAARTALGALSPQIDRFATPGTYTNGWTKPAGAKQVFFECVAGGGGGGRGTLVAAGTAVSGGAGGGSGGYTRTLINAADLTDATYTITVGSGGIGGIFPSGGAGAGTSSTVSGATLGVFVNAAGGSLGGVGTAGGASSAGSAGAPAGNTGGAGSITAAGGNGSGQNYSASSGGAGGGCGTPTSPANAPFQPFNGGLGGAAHFISGGSGSAGTASTTGSGTNGGFPPTRTIPSLVINGGGGGGGGASTFAGASGGNGGAGTGFGSGGGGGGSVSAATGTGGNGGAGAGGIVIITTYF